MAKPIKITILGDAGGLNKTLGDVDGKLGTLAKGAAAAGAVVGGALLGAGAALFKIGESFDGAYDAIRVGTGATGEVLAGLQDDFKEVVKDVPADFDSAGTAIADLNTRLGLTGEPLQNLSAQFLELSRITETDVAANIKTGADALNNWGVAAENQGAILDQLFRASQASGVSFQDLATQLADGGTVLRSVGFDVTEATSLLASLGRAGIDTSEVMPALGKAMATAAKDGKDAKDVFSETFDRIKGAPSEADAAGIAMEVFGAKAGPKLANLIREGRLSFDEMMAAVSGGSDTILQAGSDTQDFAEKWQMFKNRVMVALEPLATRVFGLMGTLMERLGPIVENLLGKFAQLEPVIRLVSTGISAFAAAFSEGDVTSDGFIGQMERLGVFLRGLVDAVLPVVTAAWQTFVGLFSSEGDKAGGSASRLGDLISSLGAMFSSVFGAIQAIVTTAIAIVTDLWDRFGQTLIQKFQVAWDALLQILNGAVTILTGVFDLLKAILTGKWGEAWEAIKKILGGAVDLITGLIRSFWNSLSTAFEAGKALISSVWSALWNAAKTFLEDTFLGPIKSLLGAFPGVISGAFKGAWGAFRSAWDGAWNGVKDFITGLLDGIKGTFDGLVGFVTGLPARIATAAAGMWDGVKNAFTSVLDTIKDAWNAFARFWNGIQLEVPEIDINGPLPGGKVGGWTIGLPNLPQFANGAVLKTPTVGLMAEYPGARTNPEIVTPQRTMAETFKRVLADHGPSTPFIVEQHFHGFSTDEAKRLAKEGTKEALDEFRQRARSA